MLSCTLREYKANYKTNLSAYLKEYEDNTPSSFLEREIKRYNAYYNSFNKIFDKLKGYDEDELKRTFFNSNSDAFNGLKKLNIRTYDGFVVKEKKHVQYNEDNDPSGLLTIVLIDLKKLKNYFKSSKLILEFIRNEEQSVVPGEEIIVDAGANDKSKKSVNPHPQVFLNADAYRLFQKLYEAFKISQNKLADFSFIYRKMYKEGYILDSFKPQMFINWLNRKPYNISLDKIKTLDNSSTLNKVQTYNTIKEVLQNK